MLRGRQWPDLLWNDVRQLARVNRSDRPWELPFAAALAMGLPIVGSAVPGIENLLARGNGVGIAVEQTPEAFAAAFRRLRDDPLEAAGLRVRARQLAETEYSMQAMFARYDRVVASLCQG